MARLRLVSKASIPENGWAFLDFGLIDGPLRLSRDGFLALPIPLERGIGVGAGCLIFVCQNSSHDGGVGEEEEEDDNDVVVSLEEDDRRR